MRCRVTHVWVNGRCLMEDRELKTLNVEELCKKARVWETTLREGNPYVEGSEEGCVSPF